MKIALLLVFCSFLGLILADSCTYVSSDSLWYYDLSPLKLSKGTPYSYTNEKGEIYYLNFCKDLDDLKVDSSIQCPKDSSVCMKKDSSFVKLGEAEDSMFADSPYGSDQGFELTYGSGQTCKEDNTVSYKTLIRFNCSSETMTVVEATTDTCFTTITILSSYACPVSNIGNYHRHRHVSSPIPFVLIVTASMCCLCLVCCCCVRRCRNRRCNTGRGACRWSNKNCKNDYTAVEFQTFSSPPVEQPVPTENAAQPQYFVMYPPQQNQQQAPYMPPMYFVNPSQIPNNVPNMPQPHPIQVISNTDNQMAADEALDKK